MVNRLSPKSALEDAIRSLELQLAPLNDENDVWKTTKTRLVF